MAVNLIQPAAGQRKPYVCQIDYWRREIQLSGKPGLHSVPVSGDHIHEMFGLQ
jgi:hypothetical protein